ncbi:hypothetical protein PUATCC27989T_05217 [Phytobacter ursingii]|uniref:YgiW/YdeI family stress tolerance OB fold protein n=1 Tax=Enterobacteriaceae TaxID=543 RepID=UPI000CD14E5C|nr:MULTISPECIES: NirD/YgiW/YdeI family stress tolerance protein [Citrobacter]AUU99589.1 hypothetical protein C2U51_00485 [Enterobacteriaceae bacterium ENNIH1]MDU6686831.1 NirD/YgiW/YdeI family stress tolerance protein [Enterobacteriaceae bacterium]VTP17221.1 hypothetical protein PUATCC27989T_05217 [Phytobacter ursingii]HAT2611161.1 NirD/YgiW/YdeI family stress tolerance protein [Kluyvera intermedia]EKY1515659.1 NirD/YgiW/YdeI family stress tolerance protein [Citrobacter freundii]
MKNILLKHAHPLLPPLSGLLLLSLCTTPLLAAEGGFESGKDPVPVERLYAGHKLQQENRQSRIKDVRDLRKNAWVTLEGNIVSKGKDSDYIFRDTTGKIDIEIPDKVWSGQHFGAQDLVRVSGRVEGQGNETKIMVDVLSKP